MITEGRGKNKLNSESNEYKEENENGRYLLVINKKTREIVPNFNYKKIKKISMENITTTALNHLKQDGLFYKADIKKLLEYEITLLYYSKKTLSSRYVMKYKDQINAIDGYYDGWEFNIKKDKEFIPFDKNFKGWRAHWLPIVVSVLQIIFLILTYCYSTDITNFLKEKIYKDTVEENFSKFYSLTNTLLAFLMFYIALVYSTVTILVKDLIKPHYLKDDLSRIIKSIIVFEIPVCIAAIYSGLKISQFDGKISWDIFIPVAAFSLILIGGKIIITYFLEKEKKQK